MTDDTLDLREYLDVIIRRWRLIVALTIAAAGVAGIISLATKPAYEATATIALAPATVSVPTTGQAPPYYLTVDSPRHLPIAFSPAYYVAILNGADVAAQVSPKVPVSVTSDNGDKSLFDITARGGDPQQVADTANKWMQVGAARIQTALLPGQDELKAAESRLTQAEKALVKFSVDNGFDSYDLGRLRGATFSSTDKQLELAGLLRAYDTSESVYLDLAKEWESDDILANTVYRPTQITAGVPTTPISPKPVQNALLGAVLGLLVGVVGAFVLDAVAPPGARIDRTKAE
ncbi:MAG: Wzz/FepE/Etk N-terminal domain-containing protein [Chloroflexi bacterium]|nr:Wzz/FepE/Etk N-terminal domain-containing protein [Chloroflexota bacterium]